MNAVERVMALANKLYDAAFLEGQRTAQSIFDMGPVRANTLAARAALRAAVESLAAPAGDLTDVQISEMWDKSLSDAGAGMGRFGRFSVSPVHDFARLLLAHARQRVQPASEEQPKQPGTNVHLVRGDAARPDGSEALLPCPFCGWKPPEDLSDVLYPSGVYRRWDERHHVHCYVSHNQSRKGDTPCWGMHCTSNMGGCGASISANSEDEAIAAWNARACTAIEPDPRPNGIESASAPAADEQALPVVRGSHIKASMFHDAGAVARCSYCRRYSDDPATLSDRQPLCDCGKRHGWCGSFVAPTADSKWSGASPVSAPEPASQRELLRECENALVAAKEVMSWIDENSHNPPTVRYARENEQKADAALAKLREHLGEGDAGVDLPDGGQKK